MSDPAIIEAAARALFASEMPGSDWRVFPGLHDKFRARARAVTPLIRAQAIEDAAKVVEDCEMNSNEEVDAQLQIIAAIRALKEQP